MKQLFQWLLIPPVTGPAATLIFRWMMGTICIFEGTTEIFYGTASNFIAAGELLGGLLVILGLLTRLTCLYLIIQMVFMIVNIQTGPSLPSAPHHIPQILNHIRNDYTEFLSCLYLLIVGPGRRSLDFRISTAGKIYRLS